MVARIVHDQSDFGVGVFLPNFFQQSDYTVRVDVSDRSNADGLMTVAVDGTTICGLLPCGAFATGSLFTGVTLCVSLGMSARKCFTMNNPLARILSKTSKLMLGIVYRFLEPTSACFMIYVKVDELVVLDFSNAPHMRARAWRRSAGVRPCNPLRE